MAPGAPRPPACHGGVGGRRHGGGGGGGGVLQSRENRRRADHLHQPVQLQVEVQVQVEAPNLQLMGLPQGWMEAATQLRNCTALGTALQYILHYGTALHCTTDAVSGPLLL